MDYFLLKQDKEYSNPPVIKNAFSQVKGSLNEICDYKKFEDNTVLQIRSADNTEFIDWIDKPIFMVSNRIKEVLDFYVPYIKFKTIMLHDAKNNYGELYYIPSITSKDCLSENSIWDFNRSGLKKIVLKKDKISNDAIFQLDGVKNRYIIARLDLVESLLRREIEGITISKIDVE